MGMILIIDDEPSIREVIREILELEDYDVCEASNGNEALELAGNVPVSLALLDVKMHGMDGFETLARLKKQFNFPVIMVSAHATVEKVAEAMKMGAYDFITKPIDMNRLLISTGHAMERQRLMEQIAALNDTKPEM